MAEQNNSTIVSRDMKFSGDIQFDGELIIEGIFQGKVKSEGSLIIQPGASLKGDVFVQRVSIKGSIEGNINNASWVQIEQTGNLFGDVETKSLSVKEGGRHNGATIMKSGE